MLVRALALGLTLTGLGVAAFVAWDWVLRTPLLATRTIAEVTGARRLDEDCGPGGRRHRAGANLFALEILATEARVAASPASGARTSCACPTR